MLRDLLTAAPTSSPKMRDLTERLSGRCMAVEYSCVYISVNPPKASCLRLGVLKVLHLEGFYGLNDTATFSHEAPPRGQEETFTVIKMHCSSSGSSPSP